jgi:hypothetical protein
MCTDHRLQAAALALLASVISRPETPALLLPPDLVLAVLSAMTTMTKMKMDLPMIRAKVGSQVVSEGSRQHAVMFQAQATSRF